MKIREGYTVRQLHDILHTLVRDPSAADIPIAVARDPEMNSVHLLFEVFLDLPSEGALPASLVLRPSDARVPGW